MIAETLQKFRRELGTVQLCAVTKGQPENKIREALVVGHRLFGENRVQEAKQKYPALRRDFPDLELHLIGPLQSNKVKQALQIFDCIQTIDRDEILQKILSHPELLTEKTFMIQVNIALEPQKSGIDPTLAPELIQRAKKMLGEKLVGLMTVPPLVGDPTPYFQELAELARAYNLRELSMGMSGDYKAAIACGATIVRIGSGIFGERS